MKKFVKEGLKLACLSLILLNPTMVSASGASAADAAAGIGLGPEDEASTKASCPYKSSADIPEGIQEYVRDHLMAIDFGLFLKTTACVSQLDPDLFSGAWDDMQAHLESLGEDECLALAGKIDNVKVKIFLGLATEEKADGDADRVAFALDTFFQYNTGRGEEIRAKVSRVTALIEAEADEEACAPLKSQLGILGKRLHAANNPESRSLPGALFFNSYLLHGTNADTTLETAFMKAAAEETDKQLHKLSETSTEITAANVYSANVLILLRAIYQAGDVALSWILQAGDDVTTAQADRYMNLSNFYHDFYGRFIGKPAKSGDLIAARATFVDIIKGLTFVHDVPAGDEAGASAASNEFPEPVFVTVPSGDEAADAVADESIADSESKVEATARLTAEMDGISAQLEAITARRAAAGDDAEVLAAIEADKAAIIARLTEIHAELGAR